MQYVVPAERGLFRTNKTANRMMVPFLEGALSLEETDHFLKHIKECSGCREDLEIYYTVRTASGEMDPIL